MIENPRIAEALEAVATALEVDGANPFRIRAYRNAADAVRYATEPLAELVAEGRDLTELPDVGAAIAEKVVEIVRLGPDAFLERLAVETGPVVFELLRIPGLGPKRVRTIRDELGIRDLEELAAACEAHRLRDLPGMGAKTEERILERVREALGEPGPGAP